MYTIFAVIGIVFLAWDLNKKAFFKLVLAGAFLFTSVVAFKFPENYLYQFLTFVVFSFVLSFFIKMILNKEQKDLLKEKALKEYIGQIAVVKKDIGKTLSIDGIGLIEFNNSLWQAKSVDDKEIKASSKVKIVSKENMIMNVEAVK